MSLSLNFGKHKKEDMTSIMAGKSSLGVGQSKLGGTASKKQQDLSETRSYLGSNVSGTTNGGGLASRMGMYLSRIISTNINIEQDKDE